MSTSMPPEYRATFFDLGDAPAELPAAFAIIAAVMPRGCEPDEGRDRRDDVLLANHLRGRGYEPLRIIGWAPTTDGGLHAEDSWLVACSKDEAVVWGREFRQDAVWWIEGDALSVVPCLGTYPETAVTPGFRARMKRLEGRG